jgi:hypothetical protein
MSKRVARKAKRKRQKSEGKKSKKIVVILCALLILTLAVGIMGEWKLLGVSKAPPPPQQGSFNANTPSKEYIYAGGRLIATEEAGNSSVTVSAPTTLTVSAASTTQINLSWAAPTGAIGYSYQIERSTDYSATSPEHGFAVIDTVNDTSYPDIVPATTPAKTYIYRVRSVLGQQTSSPTVIGFATTKVFQEQLSNQDPGRTTIKASHFLELQEAVNAVRLAAGLQPFTWTDPQGRAPGSGVPILKSHMLDLRTGLKQALEALGFVPEPYTDEGLPAGTFVKKAHIDELRVRTKGIAQ